MRKILQLTIFIFLFDFSNSFAQSANFTYSAFPASAPICDSVTLIFNDASVGATSWNWDFGVGAIPQFSNLQNPGIVNFPSCGIYQVTLNINGGGGLLTKTIPITIHCDPVACFTVNPPTACAGTPFNFNSSCSQLGQYNNSLSYVWDFFDGGTSNSANPSHTYNQSGCFQVTLVVTTNNGCTDFIQTPNAACISAPPAFQISAPITTTCLSTLQVNYVSTTPVGGTGPYTFTWTFTGGSPITTYTATGVTGQTPPPITYGTGSWTVSCTVTDISGCSTTITLPNYVNVGNNSTSIILSDDSLCVGECVNVSTAPASFYSWNINPTTCVTPNSNQTTSTVNYCFSCAGNYIVDLNSTVNGCPVSATSQTIHVFDKPVACINISSNPPSCSFPQTVNVQYCGPPTVPGYQYIWNFPGGTPSQYTGTSANPNPPAGGAITYNACGHYGMSLTVIGFAGCDSMVTFSDTVKIDCPVACYTIDNLPVLGKYCAPLTLDFDASCSTGSPTQYLWCIQPVGGPPCVPNQNLGATPTLSLPSSGCYNVGLKIINAAGCTATISNFFPGGPICVGEHTVPCFTAAPLITCAPLPVLFTNCTPDSNGVAGGSGFLPCHSWCWNFGDGDGCQSTVLDPQHLYQDTGVFDIMLVSDNCGCSDTLIIDEYIEILPPIPIVESIINCDSPNVVFYDGTGSIGADEYFWTFPGGNPNASNDSTVYVTYPMPNPNASYTAQLKICNFASNCCDSVSTNIFLRNLVGIATVDTIVCFPETSAITNTSTGAYYYTWKVFDLCNNGIQLTGLTSNARSYNSASNAGFITWPGPGRYHLWVKIGDVNGCYDTLEWNVTVRGLDPGFFGTPLTGCAPFTTVFTDTTSANCISNPVSHRFSFGDGFSSSGYTPYNLNVSHTYTTNGTFTVIDSVKDQFGCISVYTAVAYVSAQTPLVNFNVPDTTVCLGTPICFNNLSTGINLSYVWYFGDGTTSNSAFPCHTYLNGGIYSDTLYAIDANGCKDTLVKINYIIVGEVDVDFYANDTATLCPPLLDSFFVVPPNTNGCVNYYWSFGDGSFSTLDTPFHIYGYAGAFTVSLIATDLCLGCVDTVNKIDYIFLGGPYSNPQAIPNPGTGCPPVLINFDLNPTNSVSFLWDFDDGTPLINGNSAISHSYTDTGVFLPSVVLTDSSFTCTYTRFIDTIIIVQPRAKFTSSTNDLCSNGLVNFTENSWSFGGTDNSGNPINSIVSWFWDFGDGDTSNLQNPPPHNYIGFGDYIVSLTIESIGGCTDIALDTIHVTQAPTSIPIPPITGLCFGDSVDFVADTSNSSSVCSVLWDFGDGTSSVVFNPAHLYLNSGLYNVKLIVYGCNGCNDTAFTTVTISPNPIADAGPNVSICVDDTAILNATGGVSFLWTDPFPVSLSSLNTPTTLAFPTVNTTYLVIVTDVNGCTGKDSVSVTLVPPPIANITPGDSICPGNSFNLTASGGTTYLWSTGETSATIVVSPNATSTYTVTAFIGTCGDDTSTTIHVTQAPTSIPIPPITGLCFGDSVDFVADTSNSSSVCSVLWDFGDGTSSVVFNPAHLYLNSGLYNVKLIVYGCNGCNDTAFTTVTISPNPIADAGPNVSICVDDTAILNATGGVSFLWTDPFPVSLSSLNTPTTLAFPTVNTTYLVIVTDVNGCTGKDSVSVTLVPPPIANITPGDSICPGNSFNLTASGGTTYLWSTGETSATIVVSPNATSTYTVTAFIGTCGDDTSTVVFVLPLPPVDAGDSAEFCFGLSTQLNGSSSALIYLWNPSASLSDSTILNPIATPSISTTYTLTVTDTNGCKNNDTVLITVHPLPIVDAGIDKKICSGTCTQLNATGAIFYAWTPSTDLLNDSIPNPIACPADSIFYTVIGTDIFGCQGTDSLKIFVLFPFTALFPNDTCICKGEYSQLCVSSSTISFYQWKPITGLDSSTVSCVTATPVNSITYTIYVSDELGCFADTGDVEVCIFPLPTVLAGPDQTIFVGTTAQLSGYNISNPGTGTYLWIPDTTLSCNTCNNPIASPLQTTIYSVTLTDINGCKDEDTTIINVFCNDDVLFIPNAFTPNGDGLNDEVQLEGVGITKLNFLRIFNRWGQLVFESTNFGANWDGTFNGKLSEPEVFDYYLEAVCSTGQLIRKQGNITLIR